MKTQLRQKNRYVELFMELIILHLNKKIKINTKKIKDGMNFLSNHAPIIKENGRCMVLLPETTEQLTNVPNLVYKLIIRLKTEFTPEIEGKYSGAHTQKADKIATTKLEFEGGVFKFVPNGSFKGNPVEFKDGLESLVNLLNIFLKQNQEQERSKKQGKRQDENFFDFLQYEQFETFKINNEYQIVRDKNKDKNVEYYQLYKTDVLGPLMKIVIDKKSNHIILNGF